ncbi:hypothetical protein FHS15_000218 [Paenibacillus castaneae]|nr:hypothetical protein [Paenibacillus castaneae]
MQICSTWSSKRQPSGECDADMQHMALEAAAERRM